MKKYLVYFLFLLGVLFVLIDLILHPLNLRILEWIFLLVVISLILFILFNKNEKL